MKNILFVSNSIVDRNSGGVNRVTDSLANGFLKRGYNVYYYTFSSTGDTDISVKEIPQFYCKDSNDVAAETNRQHLQFLLNELKIDIIINQYGLNNKVVDFLSSLKAKNIFLISVHHNCIFCLYQNYRQIVTSNFQKRSWFRFIDNRLFWYIAKKNYLQRLRKEIRNTTGKSDRFVLLSERFKKDINLIGVKVTANTVAIKNPAPFEVQQGVLEKKENRLVFVGSVKITQKRVERLTTIWAALSIKHPGWYLDIVGEGPERKNLESTFRSKGLERYFFHGNADPRPFLEKAKFFLMTSDFEGFGMVLVESQAYAVVPIAFDSFSVLHDIVKDGVDGIVVPAFDFDEYVNRLSELMSNEPKRNVLALNAQMAVEKYQLNNVIDEWQNLFKDLELKKTNET